MKISPHRPGRLRRVPIKAPPIESAMAVLAIAIGLAASHYNAQQSDLNSQQPVQIAMRG